MIKPALVVLLSRSSVELLISLDLVSTKLYCFSARVHCYYCLNTIFSANPVTSSEELRGGPNCFNEKGISEMQQI